MKNVVGDVSASNIFLTLLKIAVLKTTGQFHGGLGQSLNVKNSGL